MIRAEQIHEHMEVVGSDGSHVGMVDHMDGTERLKLTKDDPNAAGRHHFIPMDWVQSVDSKVHLSKSGYDAMAAWDTEH
jgi:hypothetical protein